MNSRSLCPHCSSPLTQIDLLENDPHQGILFERAVIEEPLERAALQCMGNANHTFGFIGRRAVKIEYSSSHYITVEPPNTSRKARIADRIARLVLFTWPNRLPIPERVRHFIHDRLVHQWLLAEHWYVVYGPNEPWMSEEEEARILADAEADGLYEDDERWRQCDHLEIEDALYYPDDDYDTWSETWDDERDEVTDWLGYMADQADRDHLYPPAIQSVPCRWEDQWPDDWEPTADEDLVPQEEEDWDTET